MTDEQKEQAYHVSDLSEGQEPDPLGDASLTAQERATVNVPHAAGNADEDTSSGE